MSQEVDIAGIVGCLSSDGTVTSGVVLLARCAGVTPTTVWRWMRDSESKRGALADALICALDEVDGATVEALGKRLAKLEDDDVLGPVRATLAVIARG